MLLACSSLLATTLALSALDLLEMELEELLELLAIVNLLPGRVNLSSGCPGIFKPQSPPCLTFPIRKMSPAFLRPPKTKIRGLKSQIFSGATDISSPLETLPVQWQHSKVNTTATGGALRGPPFHSTGATGASHRLSSTCDRSFSLKVP